MDRTVTCADKNRNVKSWYYLSVCVCVCVYMIAQCILISHCTRTHRFILKKIKRFYIHFFLRMCQIFQTHLLILMIARDIFWWLLCINACVCVCAMHEYVRFHTCAFAYIFFLFWINVDKKNWPSFNKYISIQYTWTTNILYIDSNQMCIAIDCGAHTLFSK